MTIQLDAQQHAAVYADSRRALVLAGAGAGKTRVLIERAAHLIEDCQVSPYEILALTFTRKAAGEMQVRLEQRIGPQAHRATMGTMHAVALSLLRQFGEMVGVRSENLTVYSAWEEDVLLKDVAESLGLYGNGRWKKIKAGEVAAAFNAYYQCGVEPSDTHPARHLFRAFISRCRENNALTFGGLLTGLRLLIPKAQQYLGWKHIFVDEAQDLDALQWAVIFDLAKACQASLFVVGDMDQSIYEWRGAVPEMLLNLQRDGFDVFKVENNYRSAAPIVQAANALIEHNEKRIPKTMRATRDANGRAVFIATSADSAYLARNISGKIAAGTFAKGGAVLARNHMLLGKLSQELTALGVEHTYVGQKTVLSNSEPFRRFHAFLKLMVNPFDNFAFLLVKDLLGVDHETYTAIRTTAAEKGQSHFQAWQTWFITDTPFISLFHARSPISQLIDFKTSAAVSTIMYCMELAGQDVAEAYRQAYDFARAWADPRPKATVDDYLAWLATYDVQDELADDAAPGLILATVHAAKGLEWPVVIVAGCNEDILPSKQAKAAGEVEAERRLAYVAWTRAKDRLILAVRPERTTKTSVGRDGKPCTRTYDNPVSRFIDESGL